MFVYEEYMREEMFPLIWCKGCGNGIITKSILRAIDRLKIQKDDVAMVSGIGCAGRLPGYVDFNTLHTTHGRPLAFATGVKLARPELKVIVITGDGDGLAIGGNHFIHACRRNIDVTCILFNNATYGMTGGQVAPTTPMGMWASTMPYGQMEPSFDACKLAEAAGASFVARGTTYHAVALEKLIVEAIQHPGFSFLEVITDCPEIYGRKNKLGDPADMLLAQKDKVVPIDQQGRYTPEQLAGKVFTKILHKHEATEYTARYQQLIDRVKVEGNGHAL
ncbi:MAG TPA: 2-oxoacid:ferredoxin oxidoreductase subunit beta [bacterium]|uniref:2-oxoacid:ferredoxin oxidoreductase subunit beta n=1 Tax=Tectimicrobiota bacterium TaxID=2528274 RepID=A0A932M138_UNCTE|nr:2-oxoacid:ferredoxin oxidoreductase subunit beta [Candidatus Tectomicrobia bacterium]HLC27511.1 2-oxoacid:ferredoxin oxidoreductase subunit beta [bacterium]